MGLCTLSWGYISCLIFGLIPQLQSLSTLPYHTSFYFLFFVLFSYCCSTLYLPLSVSHLSPSPLVYCLSLCVSRLKQYLSSLWVETLLSSFVLLFSVQQVETDLLGWNNTPPYLLGSPVPSVGLLWHILNKNNRRSHIEKPLLSHQWLKKKYRNQSTGDRTII